jgi:hypothetical protein
MLIRVDDPDRTYLARTWQGKRTNHYTMQINGWYGGGFSAPSDTAALKIYNRIVRETENHENIC